MSSCDAKSLLVPPHAEVFTRSFCDFPVRGFSSVCCLFLLDIDVSSLPVQAVVLVQKCCGGNQLEFRRALGARLWLKGTKIITCYLNSGSYN